VSNRLKEEQRLAANPETKQAIRFLDDYGEGGAHITCYWRTISCKMLMKNTLRNFPQRDFSARAVLNRCWPIPMLVSLFSP
jgi:hypothetical protein